MRSRTWARLWRGLVGLGFLCTAGVLVLGWVVDRFGRVDRARRASAIVVLGARVGGDGRASPPFRARIEHGVRLWKRGLAPLLVFSGGVGDHGPSEAAIASEVARELGVPDSAILLEEGSHSTEENAELTARLLRGRGICEVVVVSDPYHLLRARQWFHREGIRAHPSPALDSPRHVHLRSRTFWTLREVAALLRDLPLLWTAQP